MDSGEPSEHSFIVKIWIEEPADEAGRAPLRGRITHVPDGVQRYFTRLDEMLHFIKPYVERMGVTFEHDEKP